MTKFSNEIQTIRLTISAYISCVVSGFDKVGGFDGLWQKYPCSMPDVRVANTTCHEPNAQWDVMLRGINDPDRPWLGFLLGQTPGSIWYWCTDQVLAY